jgi:hypothetical protein
MLKNLIIFLIFISGYTLFAETGVLKNIVPSEEIKYTLRLENGDILTGYVIESVNDPDDGEGIKFKTEIGNAIIYESQIIEIIPSIYHYRHNHRVYMLPTAEPIGNNHYIGSFELLFAYMGIGISDFLSINAGTSFIPTIPGRHQISSVGAKATVLTTYFESVNNKLSLAVGCNFALLNHNNRLWHVYGVGSFSLSKTTLHASIFAKVSGTELFEMYIGNENKFNFGYLNGSVGIGLGIDTKFNTSHDLHFIGELWNSNIAEPTKTAILIGLRLCNTNVSADFGLLFVSEPFAAPFVSFTWTPFH